MRLRIIGNWGAYPKAGSASSCYLISTEKVNVLLDIGSGGLSVLQRYFDISKLDAVFISHFHGDHFSDAFCLQHAVLIDTQLGKRKKPLTFYAPKDNTYFNELSFQDVTRAIEVNELSNISIGDLQFQFAKTVHPIYGLSMRVTNNNKVLVYTADTERNMQLTQLSKDCDVLLGECSIYKQYEGIIKGHMSGNDLGLLAKQSNAKKVIATHLPVYKDSNELIKDIMEVYQGNVVKSYEGLEIVL